MIVYRAMCQEEFDDTMKRRHFSWNSRFKWFGVNNFVFERVRDGKFNNSKFVPDRYSRIVEIDIDDGSIKHFQKVGNRELMLDRRKANMVRVNSIREIQT